MYFSVRSEAVELMDDHQLDKGSLKKAYADINRCNTLLGGTTITLDTIQNLVRKHPKKSYTIYDVGCGDGHMLRKIADVYDNKGIALNLVGIDIRDDILAIAKEASTAYPAIEYKNVDILSLDKEEQCDILLCTLTMHHFSEKELNKFIRKFAELAKVGIIVNDLERSKLAFILFKLFSLFFISSEVARKDGLISIQKGFRKSELKQMAKRLKNFYHTIKWKWAFRYLWVMEPIKSH